MNRRGNRRETTFFTEDDTALYRDRPAETVGRPAGAWLQVLEQRTGHALIPGKRGPRAKVTE